MIPVRILAFGAVVLLGGCGRIVDLKAAPGEPLPVKPLMARATPSPNDLLRIPPYAKPDRVDELVKRSEPRPQDPFNLPPATGGPAPGAPAGTDPQPVNKDTGPSTPGD
jgi:hypothetical protein